MPGATAMSCARTARVCRPPTWTGSMSTPPCSAATHSRSWSRSWARTASCSVPTIPSRWGSNRSAASSAPTRRCRRRPARSSCTRTPTLSLTSMPDGLPCGVQQPCAAAPERRQGCMTSGRLERWIARKFRLRHVELIAALSESRSILKASRRLNLTQPTLSKALQDVEATLGLSLFERTNRGLEPTPYGEIFARHAKIVLAQLRHAAEELESLRAGYSGKVTVGTLLAASASILPDAIARLKSERPGVTIDRKSTRLNSSHLVISYAVFCLKKKNKLYITSTSSALVNRHFDSFIVDDPSRAVFTSDLTPCLIPSQDISPSCTT